MNDMQQPTAEDVRGILGRSASKAIRIGPIDIAILPMTQGLRGEHWGNFDSGDLAIRIDWDSLEQHPGKLVDTMLHEILHACWWAYGLEDEDNEERTVATLATALTQVHLDNPWLARWIREKLDKFEVAER